MTQKFGQQSEQLVSKYLIDQNFSILENNYKKFFGEIDIIAHATSKKQYYFKSTEGSRLFEILLDDISDDNQSFVVLICGGRS